MAGGNAGHFAFDITTASRSSPRRRRCVPASGRRRQCRAASPPCRQVDGEFDAGAAQPGVAQRDRAAVRVRRALELLIGLLDRQLERAIAATHLPVAGDARRHHPEMDAPVDRLGEVRLPVAHREVVRDHPRARAQLRIFGRSFTLMLGSRYIVSTVASERSVSNRFCCRNVTRSVTPARCALSCGILDAGRIEIDAERPRTEPAGGDRRCGRRRSRDRSRSPADPTSATCSMRSTVSRGVGT